MNNQPQPLFMVIEFNINKHKLRLQTNSETTIEELLRNFRSRLSNDEIKIDKYLIESNNIELDPTSNETLSSKGITPDTKIIVLTK